MSSLLKFLKIYNEFNETPREDSANNAGEQAIFAGRNQIYLK